MQALKRIALIVFLCLLTTPAFAQGLSPYHKAVLDLYYQQLTSSIPGQLIVNFSVPIEKLSFFVVTNEVDPVFSQWETTNTYIQVEVDPYFNAWFSTASVVYAESDPIFSTWISTNTYFTNGVTVTNQQLIGTVTNRWVYSTGKLVSWKTNSVEVK